MPEHSMRRFIRRVGMAVLFIAVGLALTPDVERDAVAQSDPGPRSIAVSTSLVTLFPGREIRVNAAELDAGRAPRAVQMVVMTGQGQIIASVNALVTPTAPALFRLAREDIPPGVGPDALPLRVQWSFPCEFPTDPGPSTTLQVVKRSGFDTEMVSSCGCPCCDPPLHGGIQTNCGGGQRVTVLTSR